jgi:transposase
MAYLTKKSIKGHDYYYLMESARIDGKPRHTKQIYLGSAEDVMEKVKNSSYPQAPLYSKALEFGAVAALYDMATRLNLMSMINSLSTKRNQRLTLGEYLLIAIINRALQPVSKMKLADWYESTMLSVWIPAKIKELSSQRYWDNSCEWTDDKIKAFETAFLKKIAKKYHFTPKCLIYDATNFFTYIDTGNKRSTLAKRGHCKSKRNDLRIIGLSLMYSREDEFPLFYQVYEGSRNDSKQFSKAVESLLSEYEAVFEKKPEFTLIFDRGNNSEDNIRLLEDCDCNIHYVGGLKKSQCKELYMVPREEYVAVQGMEGITCYRTTKEVFGLELPVLMVHNPVLETGQLQGIKQNMEKCSQSLFEYHDRLEKRANGIVKKGKKPTEESVKKRVKDLLSAEYMEELFETTVEKGENGHITLSYSFSSANLDALRKRELGKTVLFTNHHDWADKEIIEAYRSAWKIEHTFRQMKDHSHLAVRPMWNWTDQKVKVHIFCCVMALRLCVLIKRELREKGVIISIDSMLDKLGKSKQFIHYHQQRRGLKEVYSTTKDPKDVEEMLDILELNKYKIKVR